jgi:putative ABC transport system permease protein
LHAPESIRQPQAPTRIAFDQTTYYPSHHLVTGTTIALCHQDDLRRARMPSKPSRFFQFPWRSRKQIARDVDSELSFHLEMRVNELTAAGMSSDEARRRARDEFGDLERTRAYCRDVDERAERGARSSDRLMEWYQDARYAWRTMRRSPAFALVSVLTLVLAIGANTAIFSVTRAVLLEPLPYGTPASLVAVYENDAKPSSRYPLSTPNFVDYRAAQRTLTGIAAYYGREITWRPAKGDPQLLSALLVTTNTFEVLQARAALGRTFAAGDDATGSAPKVVLSYRFWQSGLGADPTIVGSSITLNDLPYEVIGVMPRTFALGTDDAMWTPLNVEREMANPDISRKQYYLRVIGRLKPGMPFASAQADLVSISRRLAAQYPEANTDRTATLVPLHADLVGDLRKALLLLQGAAALVLLIACVNLANVALSRTIGRRREMALRAALGAGRGRLIRQLLTESVLLAAVGGALGTALAVFATRALLALNPGTLPALFDVRLDVGVLVFGLALSVATGIVFGVLPALDAARGDLHGALKEGGRGASGGRQGERVRRALVVAQVGLAVVLLVGAGLLTRTFAELTRVRLGFNPDHVLTAQIRVSGERYDSAALVNRFYDRVLEDVRRSPGVTVVGAAMKLPTGGRMTSGLVVDGQPTDPTHLSSVGYTLIRGEYFKALGIPLVTGRTFDEHDTPDAPGVVIVNQAAARAFFRGGEAVGGRVRLGPNPAAPWSVVIGVVGDIRDQGFDVTPGPAVFASHVQNTWWRSLAIVIRTTSDPRVAEPALRRAVRHADPALALRDVRSLEDVLGSSLGARRFALGLVSCFAGVALVLAAVGIYGVLAFSVTSRTREFGVRLALGATTRNILVLVVGQGMAWSLVGLTLGIAGAVAGGRLLSGLLYGVTPTDVTTFVSVALGLLLVVVVASLVPAARAMRVDPTMSMRAE